MKPRHLVLAAALVLSALAVWLDRARDTPDEDIVEAVARPAQAAKTAVTADIPPAAGNERLGESAFDLFAARDWRPPPPPPASDQPARPETPALPYRYLGRWEVDGALTVILGQGDLSVPARSGQVLDGQWRIDRIAPGHIDFTYLPLKTRARLALEEPQ